MKTGCCPRCGYDLGGIAASWREACPLRGVCSECGLEVDWSRVLNAERWTPTWLVEHAAGWWGVPRASWRNGWQALCGRKWWRGMRLDFSVHAWRFMLHWCLWLFVMWLGAAVIAGLSAAVYEAWEIGYLQRTGFRYPGQPITGGEWWQALGRAAWDGALHPWWSLGRALWVQHQATWTLPLALLVIACWGTAFVLAFGLLPRTLTKTGVRLAHVVRGAGYFASPCVVGVWCWLIADRTCIILDLYWPPMVTFTPMFGTTAKMLVVAGAVAAWWTVWWWRFASEYLRLPRAWLVALALGVIATFAALAFEEAMNEQVADWCWRWLR
ncbi:MAG: hypothetical protein QM783_19165 [Phycisphaerales bacterium]